MAVVTDLVTGLQFLALLGFDHAVEHHQAFIDRRLGLTATLGQSAELEELAEFDGDGADLDGARRGGVGLLHGDCLVRQGGVSK